MATIYEKTTGGGRQIKKVVAFNLALPILFAIVLFRIGNKKYQQFKEYIKGQSEFYNLFGVD